MPTPAPGSTAAACELLWQSEEQTRAFAQRLATCPELAQATLTLRGDLGAGKTTFVRHLLRALGVQGRIKSPTYAVVEPHHAHPCPLRPDGEALPIWHFDFYRFNDPREWEDAGFRELFAGPGLKLVEWPEKAGTLLPVVDAALDIRLADPMPAASAYDPSLAADEIPPSARQVRLTALTPRGRALLAACSALPPLGTPPAPHP